MLTPFVGGVLEARGDHEAVDLAGLDLSGQRADAPGFLQCRFVRCRMDELALPRARISECLLRECGGTRVDLTGSVVRDTLIEDGRIGVLGAAGATWSSVRLRGGKVDLVDLSVGRHGDLAFEGCTLGVLDLTGSQVRTVRFEACEVGELVLDDARLADVDLTGATLRVVRGIGQLRGVTVSREQLVDIAPLLAAHVGLAIRDD